MKTTGAAGAGNCRMRMNRIINGLKRLVCALGFCLGAFAFLFVGAFWKTNQPNGTSSASR